ncbi:hypothetical protein HGO21_03480 [Acinetobacter sp. CUI P1]|nr:hypothetical protein [Acinetobacter sp. CUI P1]
MAELLLKRLKNKPSNDREKWEEPKITHQGFIMIENSSGIEKYGYAAELEKRGYLERNAEGKFQKTNKTL